jgi:sec-independent protein translocase protein TatB
MFEVGFTEILLIFALALLVLGPARLPKLATDLGRWAGRARAMARQLRTQLEQEVQYDPLKDSPGTARSIHAPAQIPDVPSPNLQTPVAPAAAAAPATTESAPVTAPAMTEAAPVAAGGSDEPKP